MMIRFLLLLFVASFISSTTQAVTPKEFLDICKKGNSGIVEGLTVIMIAIRDAHPTFFESNKELIQFTTDIVTVFSADRTKGIEAALALAPTITKKMEQYDKYVEELDWTDAQHDFYEQIDFLGNPEVQAILNNRNSNYRSVIEHLLNYNDEVQSKFEELSEEDQEGLIEKFPIIGSFDNAIHFAREVLKEDDKIRKNRAARLH